MRVRCRTILIAYRQGQRLRCAMCGMSEGLRSQCLQTTPESRAHCVAARGEQRHFHWRNFGFLSIRRAALWVPAVFICLCTVGIGGAAEACTFQTTSGGCINSHPWRNIKGRKFHPMITIFPAWIKCVCLPGFRVQTDKQNLNSDLTFKRFETSWYSGMSMWYTKCWFVVFKCFSPLYLLYKMPYIYFYHQFIPNSHLFFISGGKKLSMIIQVLCLRAILRYFYIIF